MRHASTLRPVVIVWLAIALLRAAPAGATAGAVATEHQLAADAGAEVLRGGGNAVDAALAAAAAICIVHAQSCGIGGGGFALVRLPNGRVEALDFREIAPAAATPERYFQDGKPMPERLRRGGLAVGVPGEIAGWVTLHAKRGHAPLAAVLAPAIRLARDGVPLADAPTLARQIERTADLLRADPGLRATFLGPDGAPPAAGARIVQADLARTLEAVVAKGRKAFYTGDVAAKIAATIAERGGVLTTQDLAAYEPVWRTALRGTYRGHEVWTFPPPGSGGIVLEVLGILGADQPTPADALTAPWLHLLAGALAQGFTDRARWYGDPGFTDVPLGRLLAPARLEQIRNALASPTRPTPLVDPPRDNGTAHVSVVTADGGAVALTTTINTSFGAGISVPGTGIILNNEMDDFAVAPGVPNVYGLLGSEANAVRPGKRPQSSMSPTIVVTGDRPALVVGGSGGPLIISGTTEVLINAVALGMDVPAAVAAPRIHDQGVPPAIVVEPGIPAATREALGRYGHPIKEFKALGAVSAVAMKGDGGFEAAGDPRKDGGQAIVPR